MAELREVARLRALHAAAGAPSVDIQVDEALLITNLGFSDVSNYTGLAAGDHSFRVFPSGSAVSGQEVIAGDIRDVRSGMDYTMAVLGEKGEVHAQMLEDRTAAPMGDRAKVRLFHASPDAPAVNVTAGGSTLFSDVAFRDVTPFVEVPAGSVDIQVRSAIDDTVVLTVPNYRLEAGNVYTLVGLGLIRGTPSFKIVALEMVAEERVLA